jgi:hypothetical protein
MNPCPCRLTQGIILELAKLGINKLDANLSCTAEYADKTAVDENGHRLICGESLGAHPHAPLGKNIL